MKNVIFFCHKFAYEIYNFSKLCMKKKNKRFQNHMNWLWKCLLRVKKNHSVHNTMYLLVYFVTVVPLKKKKKKTKRFYRRLPIGQISHRLGRRLIDNNIKGMSIFRRQQRCYTRLQTFTGREHVYTNREPRRCYIIPYPYIYIIFYYNIITYGELRNFGRCSVHG